jgi:hypothetical protein
MRIALLIAVILSVGLGFLSGFITQRIALWKKR